MQAEWEKVANNIEMERVTRVGIYLKRSKCGNVVFATRNKGNYKIDNYCSHCGARMSEKVGEGDVWYRLRGFVEDIWTFNAKKNETTSEYVEATKKFTVELIKEAIQVGAMCDKFLDYLEKR